MAEKLNDPGFGSRFNVGATRLVNKDGKFNVRKVGSLRPLQDIYFYLLNIPWMKFHLLVLCAYASMNTFFALIYLGCGVDQFNGIEDEGLIRNFISCCYFSAQSLTTVGYGNISPATPLTQILASFEALLGLMSFAVTTGILYGRFSKPKAKIVYSTHALISPFNGGRALMVRIANKRNNTLMRLEAVMLFSKLEKNRNGELMRQYYEMQLQISEINAMPLSWTIVHPIDENSPLYAFSKEELKAAHAEVLVEIKGYDETFNDDVYSRSSYMMDEVIEGALFRKAFDTDANGVVVLDLNKISNHELVKEEIIA